MAVDVDAIVAAVAVDRLVLHDYLTAEPCKNHVVYAVYAAYAVFLVFLDFLHFAVDLALLDYSQWIVFFAFAWVNHQPLDYVASVNSVVETLEDDARYLIDVEAWEKLKDDYVTSDLVVDIAISLVN